MPESSLHKKFSPGFTMIEVLIAVLIIAILTAIAIPQFQAFAYRSIVTEGVLQMNYLEFEELSYLGLKDRYGNFTELQLAGWIEVETGLADDGNDVSSAELAFLKYFTYTIMLDPTKTRCTLSARYQDGKLAILLSTLFENGSHLSPLSVLYHYF